MAPTNLLRSWTQKPPAAELDRAKNEHAVATAAPPPHGPLAFPSNRTGDPELYVADVASADARQLTNRPGLDVLPDWSPNGKQIVFQHTPGGLAH